MSIKKNNIRISVVLDPEHYYILEKYKKWRKIKNNAIAIKELLDAYENMINSLVDSLED